MEVHELLTWKEPETREMNAGLFRIGSVGVLIVSVAVAASGAPANVPTNQPTPSAAAEKKSFAVKVTACPEFDGLSDEPSPTVVESLFTATATAPEVLGVSLLSPL